MAADDQIFQTLKHSFSLADIDSDMEFISNNLTGLLPNSNEDYSSAAFNFHNSIIFPQLSPLAHGSFQNGGLSQPMITSTDDDDRKQRKRKATDHLSTPEMSACSYSSSPQVSDCGTTQNKNRGGGGGRGKKGTCKGEEKPREVIHVRARRGQATDSHSLAERVRRGKINERLRCLQDIVPGCYKTMGMAVMLDEIINYVQSLQNQVEFLSMKLTAASTFYDFNADTDAMEQMQRANALEAMKGENISIVAKQGVPYAQAQLDLGYILPSASTQQMKNED